MELECYDMSWRGSEGSLWLEALVPDGDGGKRVDTIPAPFDPYCYIKEGDLTMDPLRACNCRIGDDAPEGYLKIEAEHPNAIRDFKDRFAFQTYEADVRYDRRVAINENVTFLRPDVEDTLYFDIEVDDRGRFAQPENADARVISIAGVGGDGREFYFDDDNERDLLKDFIEAADEYVCLVGWNSLGYDFPYLENRYANKGMAVNWRRWVRHDLMPLYDMLGVPTKTVSLKLGDTGERELGTGKEDVMAGDGRLYELWQEEPETLERYNIRDCEIVRDVDDKYGLVEVLHVISELCNYPPGETCYVTKHDTVKFAIGMVVDALVLEVAHHKGIPQPNRRSFEKPDDFPGGYVLEPEPGMYDWLMAPDYSGMYPNIIRSWNFGRETWVPDEHLAYDDTADRWYITKGEYEGKLAIKGETGGFVHPDEGPRSVPAEAADRLVDMREDASNVIDKGVKAVNNTLYGVFASDFHRYFGQHSENITLVGQQLTSAVERIAEGGDSDIRRVVYGDTDSVMLEMDVPLDIDVEDAVEVARGISADIESEMKEWARGRGAIVEHLMLDLDDVYDRFYIGDKKKRYFGHRVFDGEFCDGFKVRGFETRQNSWPGPVRDFQEELMRAKLEDGPVRDIINEARERLYSGEWDIDMATSTTLSQPVKEYANPLPHTRAAQAIRSHHGRSSVQVGDKVNYIKYGPDKEDVAWVYNGELGVSYRPNEGWCPECGGVYDYDEHPHDQESWPNLRDRHYEYLWEKKFVSVMESIGVSEYEQTGLGAYL